jgi:hypothetical protein
MEGVNSRIVYVICCQNFYKCHHVPPSSTTINKDKKRQTFCYKGRFCEAHMLISNSLSHNKEKGWRGRFTERIVFVHNIFPAIYFSVYLIVSLKFRDILFKYYFPDG